MLSTPCTMILDPRWGLLRPRYRPVASRLDGRHARLWCFCAPCKNVLFFAAFICFWLSLSTAGGVRQNIHEVVSLIRYCLFCSKELLRKSSQTSRTTQMPGQGLTPFWSSLRTWKLKYASSAHGASRQHASHAFPVHASVILWINTLPY